MRGKRLALTLEEHPIIGALGSAVAELLAETARTPRLLRIGVHDRFGQSASADELLEYYGLTPASMAKRILQALRA